MRRRLALIGSVALLGSLVAGCGDLGEEADSGDQARGELIEGTTTTNDTPKPDLATPTPGAVQIDGNLEGSLTQQAVVDFGKRAESRGLAISVDAQSGGEAAGFEALCTGEVDLVDSPREITPEELEACGSAGLEVVEFRIAFDATVVVTRNERDVGADCVNFDQLRAMYASGSPVTAWNQINPNFFALRLVPIGPGPESTDLALFGQRVFEVPNPSLADFRSDYLSFSTENEIKNEVVGNPPGVVAIVSFSFYELFEDKLRPLEIDGQTGDRCVFPSDETIATELYPLERTLRLYTTQRSLDRPEVQGFLQFYLQSAEGLAAENDLIPISDAVKQQQIARLTDETAYAEVADGAVSEPSPTGTVTTSSTTSTTTEPSTSTTTTSTTSTTTPTTSTSSSPEAEEPTSTTTTEPTP